MNSRERILQTVRTNKPVLTELPKYSSFKSFGIDLTAAFSHTLAKIGGECIIAPDFSFIAQDLIRKFPETSLTVNRVNGLPVGSVDLAQLETPEELEKIFLAIIPGKIGVAENASIWVEEEDLGKRVLPFICQHLVIVLDHNKLVENMHEAYQNINVGGTSYGVFIAGPSKTADIEQSLVIGAHGARSLIVYLAMRNGQ